MRALRQFARSGVLRRRVLAPIVALAALGLAAYLLHRQLGKYTFAEIRGALAAIGPGDLLVAGLFAAGSYFCLTLSEAVSVRYAGRKLPYPRIALTSFVSLSLGHNLGFAALSSGAVRYRIYSGWGFGLGDVARIIVLCGSTVALGYASMAAVALLVRPQLAAESLALAAWTTTPIGLTLALAVACYLLLAWRADGAAIRLWRWRLAVPRAHLAVLQVLIGAANIAFVAAALHRALSATAEVDYLATAALYVLASAVAIASHVPGGLGVLEAVVLAFSPELSTLGGLLAFRFVYFLVPLGLGALLFAAFEIRRRLANAGGASFVVPQPRGGDR